MGMKSSISTAATIETDTEWSNDSTNLKSNLKFVMDNIDMIKRNETSKKTKRVMFSNVEIRSYPIVLGDHPGCSSGPPISLDWKHASSVKASVDAYEKLRPKRRIINQLIVPSEYRKKMLRRNCNYTEKEMKDAMATIAEIKNSRQKTAKSCKSLRISQMTSALKSSFKGVFISATKDGSRI